MKLTLPIGTRIKLIRGIGGKAEVGMVGTIVGGSGMAEYSRYDHLYAVRLDGVHEGGAHRDGIHSASPDRIAVLDITIEEDPLP